MADTFDFLRFRVNHPLNEMKAFSPNFRNGGLYSDMIRCENLLYKVGFDMNNDYADLFLFWYVAEIVFRQTEYYF